MLIIFGFVCLLHLPTSELRRTANVNFWTEVARMNSTQEFYRKYVNKAYEMLRGYEDTLQGSIQQESPEPLFQEAPLFPCYPMNTSVPLPADPDPRYERVPPCGIVPRCGGCCGPIYTCLPKTIVPYPVKVFRGIPGPDETFTEVTLMVDRHTECECSCAIVASDCNPTTHTYISAECLCRCKMQIKRPAARHRRRGTISYAAADAVISPTVLMMKSSTLQHAAVRAGHEPPTPR